jgi:protein gp37
MENTAIQWATHTFNAWRGCTKISPGCANCYAAVNMSVKLHGITWGPRGERVVKAESGWAEPLAWDRAAAAAGERHRVFCASLADVFEGPDTMPDDSWAVVEAARLRLFDLIRRTPHLDWLLLTKRPEQIHDALQRAAQSTWAEWCAATNLPEAPELTEQYRETVGWLTEWYYQRPPANVWLGTSVENQEQADIRVPQLLAAPAALRFLSCEPLLGFVKLDAWLKPRSVHVSAGPEFWQSPVSRDAMADLINKVAGQTSGLHWVIVGGESGPKARPMHPEWARDLRIQCEDAGIPFLFKQWGEWASVYDRAEDVIPGNLLLDGDGKTVAAGTVPADRIWFEFGAGCESTVHTMKKVGKKEAGRLLEGKEYNQFPSPAAL